LNRRVGGLKRKSLSVSDNLRKGPLIRKEYIRGGGWKWNSTGKWVIYQAAYAWKASGAKREKAA